MSEQIEKKRNPLAAGLFSLLIGGLGQFYNGQIKKALVLYLIDFILQTLVFIIFGASFSSLIFLASLLFIYRLACSIEAGYQARKFKTFVLKKYNRWYFYILYIIAVYLINVSFTTFAPNVLNYRSFSVPTGAMEKTIITGDWIVVKNQKYQNDMLKRNDIIVFEFPGGRDEIKSPELVYYIKRCMAIAGDSLQIIDNQVYVNNNLIPRTESMVIDTTIKSSPTERFDTFPLGKGFSRDNYGPIKIPKKNEIININITNIREWEVFIEREGHKVRFENGIIMIDGKAQDTYKVEKDYCFVMGDNRYNSVDSRYWGFLAQDKIIGTPLYVYWSWNSYIPITNLNKRFSSIRWDRIGYEIK